MSNYSRGEVVLVRYPFSDLSGLKIRPAVIVNAPHISKDVLILPLTSVMYLKQLYYVLGLWYHGYIPYFMKENP
jgi:hypothetical protein